MHCLYLLAAGMAHPFTTAIHSTAHKFYSAKSQPFLVTVKNVRILTQTFFFWIRVNSPEKRTLWAQVSE
jgi:hypothetical protein